MPFIIIKGKKLSLDRLQFNDNERIFEISSSEDSENNVLKFDYILTPVRDDSDPKNYTLHLLYKQDFSENDIFQVYDNQLNDRIGWIFPLQSLTSREHDLADNPHFLRYAFAAFQMLLVNNQNPNQLSPHERDTYELREIYPENCIALVLANEKLPDDFSLDPYLPSLFKYGYYLKDIRDVDFMILPHSSGPRFTVQKVAADLSSDSYIRQVFHDLIYEKHPLVKFHILYQVIECLIERILHHELESLSNKLKTRQIYTSDFQEKFKSFMAQEKRIKKLFSEYVGGIDTVSLRDSCRSLLKCIGKEDPAADIGKLIYMVRNFIVHDYRNLPNEEAEKFGLVNSNLQIVVADLLLRFRYPS